MSEEEKKVIEIVEEILEQDFGSLSAKETRKDNFQKIFADRYKDKKAEE